MKAKILVCFPQAGFAFWAPWIFPRNRVHWPSFLLPLLHPYLFLIDLQQNKGFLFLYFFFLTGFRIKVYSTTLTHDNPQSIFGKLLTKLRLWPRALLPPNCASTSDQGRSDAGSRVYMLPSAEGLFSGVGQTLYQERGCRVPTVEASLKTGRLLKHLNI